LLPPIFFFFIANIVIAVTLSPKLKALYSSASPPFLSMSVQHVNGTGEPEGPECGVGEPKLDHEELEPKRRRPESQDWERVRTIIKRLYVDEDKTLREVISIMETEHSHFGT
jgi:hypothetical protein